jgi:hypothetical protein
MHKNTSYKNRAIHELEIGVKFDDLVDALRKLSDKDREEFIENLLAATSPAYVNSIREARDEYKKGKVHSHEAVFGRENSKKEH